MLINQRVKVDVKLKDLIIEIIKVDNELRELNINTRERPTIYYSPTYRKLNVAKPR